MSTFNTNDVIALAKAVLDDPVEYFDSDRRSIYFCHFCDAELDSYGHRIEDFKHDLNCPVLIAQDVLTGM